MGGDSVREKDGAGKNRGFFENRSRASGRMGNSFLKVFLKLFVGIVVIPSAVIVSIYLLDQRGFFNVDHINVVVNNLVDQPAYLKPIVKDVDDKMEKYRGRSLWKIDISEIKNILLGSEYLEEVFISRQWPSHISVQLKVKEVKLLLVDRTGQFFPVVQQGELMSSIQTRWAPDVPLLQGEKFERKKELRKKAVQLIDEIPESGAFSKKTISEVHYDEKEGFWVTLIKKGMKVKMGQEQFPLKGHRVSQVLEYIEARQIDVEAVDANFSKKVLVRTTNKNYNFDELP